MWFIKQEKMPSANSDLNRPLITKHSNQFILHSNYLAQIATLLMNNLAIAFTVMLRWMPPKNYKKLFGRWCRNKEEISIAIFATESNKIIWGSVDVVENGSSKSSPWNGFLTPIANLLNGITSTKSSNSWE